MEKFKNLLIWVLVAAVLAVGAGLLLSLTWILSGVAGIIFLVILWVADHRNPWKYRERPLVK